MTKPTKSLLVGQKVRAVPEWWPFAWWPFRKEIRGAGTSVKVRSNPDHWIAPASYTSGRRVLVREVRGQELVEFRPNTPASIICLRKCAVMPHVSVLAEAGRVRLRVEVRIQFVYLEKRADIRKMPEKTLSNSNDVIVEILMDLSGRRQEDECWFVEVCE